MNIPAAHIAQIFARYYGQNIAKRHNSKMANQKTSIVKDAVLYENVWYLELKPLSKISDEHTIEVAKLMSGPACKISSTYVKRVIEKGRTYDFTLTIWQYLQCLGYALPQTVIENGKPITYTVDQLVEAGVYKFL